MENDPNHAARPIPVDSSGRAWRGASPHAPRKILLVGLVFLVLLTSWVGYLDRKTEEYLNGALTKALVTYASVRSINATLSLLLSGETTANVSILGTGGALSAQPARVLEPFDDLAEEFSGVVKFATISLVAQKVLVGIFSSAFFKILLTATGLLLVVFFLCGVAAGYPLLLKAFLFTAFLRFCLLFSLGASQLADQAFLAPAIEEDSRKIAVIEREVRANETPDATLSPEQRRGIEARQGEIAEEIRRLEETMEGLRAAIPALRERLESEEGELRARQQDRSTFERLNPLQKEPEIDEARRDRDGTRSELQLLLAEIEEGEEALESLAEEEAVLESRLLGRESAGFVDHLFGEIGSLTRRLDFSSLGESIESLVDSALRLMALFLLQVLLIPLACFFLFFKVFARLWKSDLRNPGGFLRLPPPREP